MEQKPKFTYIRTPDEQVSSAPESKPKFTYIRKPTLDEEFDYGLDVSKSDIGYGLDYLRANMPFGSFKNGPDGFRYYTANEIYGEDFESLSKEERRQRIIDVDQQEADQNNITVSLFGRQDSPAALAGNFLGSLASPTTLIPIGGGAKAGYKAVALASGLLGAEYSALEQLATKGEVEAAETGKVAGLSAVGGVAFLGGARGLSKLKNLAFKKKTATPDKVAEAQSKVDEINDATLEAAEQNISKENLSSFIQGRVSMSSDEMAEAIALSPEKPIVLNQVDSFNAKVASQLGAGEEVATKYAKLKEMVLPQSDVIRDINPELALKIRDYHRKYTTTYGENMRLVEPLMNLRKKMPVKLQEDFDSLLLHSNAVNKNKLKNMVSKIDPELTSKVDDLYNMMQKQRSRIMKNTKIVLPDDPYYITKEVKDFAGFRKAIGKPLDNKLTTALQKRADYLKINKNDLDEQEKNFIANAIVRGLYPFTDKKGRLIAKSSSPDAKPGFLKKRKVDFIDKELQKYYYSPLESVARYLQKSERMIRKRELFGTNAAYKGNQLDIDGSIANIINDLESRGNLSDKDLNIISSILDAQFKTGEKQMGKVVSGFKNLTHASFLANYGTSIIQLADAGITAWVHGFRHTLGALLTGGKKKLDSQELFMLDSTIAEHYSSGSEISKSLDLLMKVSGFKFFDKFGKDLVVNTAWRRAQSLVKSEKGIQKLKKEVGDAFPTDFDELVDDISKGKITKRTTLPYLYSKVSDQYLTSPFEMPLKYSQMQNGRIMYTLKSFTIKQLALMRREIANEWNTGNKKQAIRNAIAFSLLVPTTNLTVQTAQDLMLGREVDLDSELGDRYVDNIFKVFASSQYAVNKLAKTKNVEEFVTDTFAPPLSVFNNLIAGAWNSIENGEFDPKTLKDVPFLGKFYYNFFGGGLEEYNERKEKQKFNDLFGDE